MRDGGIRLADYAIQQWMSGKYGLTYDVQQENIRRWRRIQVRTREIAREWKHK